MPLFNETMLSDKSLQQLLEDCNNEITDVFFSIVQSLKNIQNDLKHYNKLMVKNSKANYLTTLKTLDTILKKHENTSDNFNLAFEFFKEGKAVFYYETAKKLMKEYGTFFEGSKITLESILKCQETLKEISISLSSISSTCNPVVDSLQKVLLTVDIEKIRLGSLQENIQKIQEDYQKLIDYLENYELVLNTISSKLWNALSLFIVMTANKEGLDFYQEFDAKTFFEQLSKINSITKPLEVLKSSVSNAAEVLFSYLQSYKTFENMSRQADNFHPSVRRTRYLNQGLSLAGEISRGYCSGGIRYWHNLPCIITPIPPFKRHYELNESEPDDSLINLQRNLNSFLQRYNSGNTTHHNIITVKIEKNSKNTDKNEEIDTNILAFQQINNLIDKLPTLAQQYNHQATFEFTFYQGTDPFGHAVGFKVIEHQQKIYYLFRDYNNGEFFTEDLNALKIWVEKFFKLFKYDQNLSEYALNVIRNKYSLSPHPMKQAFEVFEKQSLIENISRQNWERSLKKPFLIAFQTFSQSTDLVELKDNNIREKLKALLPQIDDEKTEIAAMKAYLELCPAVVKKNEGDYLYEFMLRLGYTEYLTSEKEILAQLQAAEDIAKKMKAIDANYKSIDRYLWIKYAGYFIDLSKNAEIFPTDPVFRYLMLFRQATKTLTLDDLFITEGYEEFILNNEALEKVLLTKPIPKAQLKTVIKKLEKLFLDNGPLWMTERLVNIYMNILESNSEPEKTAFRI